LLSPKTTPLRMFVGNEDLPSIVDRHLQHGNYNEACKATREFLEQSADVSQVNTLITSFQQSISAVLPVANNSVAATKCAAMLLEMLVTLSAYSPDATFFRIVFSSVDMCTSSPVLLQHACSVVGCSVDILDAVHQQNQSTEKSDIQDRLHAAARDILDACQVWLAFSNLEGVNLLF
jgi:hypothetical protein